MLGVRMVYDNLDRWQSEIDREIEKLLEAARREGLPGEGKPLDLREDSTTPDDMRLAYKIMKDHDVVPEWIMLGKELDRAEAALRKRIARVVRDYAIALQGSGTPKTRQAVGQNWARERRRLITDAEKYNDRVLTYNLKVPPGIIHRRLLQIEKVLDQALRDAGL